MKSSCKESCASSSNTKFIESTSFKQIIRGVESLIDDDDEMEISTFQADLTATTPVKSKKTSATNGEKLALLMKTQDLRDKITVFLKTNCYFDIFPILKLTIQSALGEPSEFPITEDALVEVFKRFQNLERVIIIKNNNYIFFNDHLSAFFAERTMNDMTFRLADVKLIVKWCQPHQYYEISHFLNFQKNCPLPELTRANSNLTPKFTCRYKIQIDNQRDFQVARRIIGPKGSNMKKIIDNCMIEIGADPSFESDSIKLRLRGRGSGYKEGPNKTQSDDPLHLCISCKQEKAYAIACELVEGLLGKVYEEYRGFCIRTGRKVQNFECEKMDSLSNPSQPPSNQSFYIFSQFEGPMTLTQTEIKTYIEARNKARRELNFMEADRIRSFLKNRGIVLIDEKGGRGRGVEVTTWKFAQL